jgi:hypothetical protein
MPPAIEVLTGRVTAPGAVLTAWTPNTGVSLGVRNCPLDRKVYLLDMWAFNQVTGALRVRSPRIHDNVQGIRITSAANQPASEVPVQFRQPLVPQDVLIVEQSGSAVCGQIEVGALQLYYEDLTGVQAILADEQTVFDRGQNLVTQELALAPGATGDYTGQQALNALFDTLKANTWYALLGMTVNVLCLGVGIRGVDSGNLRVMVPGDPGSRDTMAEYFLYKARRWGIPLIPVFNSANKFGIFVDIVQNQAAAAVTWDGIFVELAPDWMQTQAARRGGK